MRDNSHNFHRTFRQGVKKGLTVLLRQNPVVRNRDDAGVDLLSDKEQFGGVKKVPAKVNQKPKKRSSHKRRLSLYELSKDLCGSVSGPPDMSTRPLTGYGRD
jgi:hypothetical protein